MKALTSLLVLATIVASVTIPGLASAGVAVPFTPAFGLGLVLAGAAGILLILAQSVDQVRTGASQATNYYAKPIAAPQATIPVTQAFKPIRRVSAITELAA